MIEKGKYYLKYTINKIENELIVLAEIRSKNRKLKQYESLYYAYITVNYDEYTEINTDGYLDAQCAAEYVGLELKRGIRIKCRKEGKTFRTKKEKLKFKIN